MANYQEITTRHILDVPMGPNDADATTVRGYLVALLARLWRQRDMFGGKRPFGNSGWEYDLYEALARAGYIQAAFDEDDCLASCDTHSGDDMIARAIFALGD